MKRFFLCAWLFAALFCAAGLPAQAKEAFSAFISEQGDRIEIAASYDGGLGDLGAVMITVRYDSERFQFLKAGMGTEDGAGYMSSGSQEGEAYWLYTMQNMEGLGPGELFCFLFQLKEGASSGGTDSFSVEITQCASLEGEMFPESLGGMELEYRPAGGQAFLYSLVPSVGELSPDFSSDILAYTLRVPYEITSLLFEAQACEGASYRINRKNLGPGGSDTRFDITVTGQDTGTKRVYTVTVYREEKPPATPRPTATPQPTKTPKPTATPKPTNTPKPTATPKPTKTPKPTATPKPTNTPKPTATPKPTKTPKPTATPKPTNTPKPTATPKPTKTPKPTATPKPTKTPKPTATPKPTKTPKPTATPKPAKTPSPSPAIVNTGGRGLNGGVMILSSGRGSFSGYQVLLALLITACLAAGAVFLLRVEKTGGAPSQRPLKPKEPGEARVMKVKVPRKRPLEPRQGAAPICRKNRRKRPAKKKPQNFKKG